MAFNFGGVKGTAVDGEVVYLAGKGIRDFVIVYAYLGRPGASGWVNMNACKISDVNCVPEDINRWPFPGAGDGKPGAGYCCVYIRACELHCP